MTYEERGQANKTWDWAKEKPRVVEEEPEEESENKSGLAVSQLQGKR